MQCRKRLLQKSLVGLALVFGWAFQAQAQECPDVQAEARAAHDYLNRVRANPDKLLARLGLRTSKQFKMAPLRWNALLADIAQRNAEQMARLNYFDHRSPNGIGPNQRLINAGYELPGNYPRDPLANQVESLAAGAESGVEAIEILLRDDGLQDAYHRMHLLSQAEMFQAHSEVGIGVACAPSSEFRTYFVILTAPPRPAVLVRSED